MKALKTKLRSQRGETLVEVLASILIASLSVALLLGGVAVSANLERQADQTDKYFYETLTAAESHTSAISTGVLAPNIEVKENGIPIKIPIHVYGGEGLYSYALNTTVEGGVTP